MKKTKHTVMKHNHSNNNQGCATGENLQHGFGHLLPLLGLALLAAFAFVLMHLGSSVLALGGLALASAPLVLTEEQIKEFQGILGEMKGGWAELRALPATFKSLRDENTQFKDEMGHMRRMMATRTHSPRFRAAGLVSDDCARHLSAHFIMH